MGGQYLDDLSERLARATSRRKLLARAAAWTAGGLAALLAPAFAQAGGPSGSIVVLDRGPQAGLGITACGIYCKVVDCCTPSCCSGYKLFKCTSQCDGSYFYLCSTPCTNFCYSQYC